MLEHFGLISFDDGGQSVGHIPEKADIRHREAFIGPDIEVQHPKQRLIRQNRQAALLMPGQFLQPHVMARIVGIRQNRLLGFGDPATETGAERYRGAGIQQRIVKSGVALQAQSAQCFIGQKDGALILGGQPGNLQDTLQYVGQLLHQGTGLQGDTQQIADDALRLASLTFAIFGLAPFFYFPLQFGCALFQAGGTLLDTPLQLIVELHGFLFYQLAPGDVDAATGKAKEKAVVGVTRQASFVHPAIGAFVADQAKFGGIGFPAQKGILEVLPVVDHILLMNAVSPAAAKFLFQNPAPKIEPGLIEENPFILGVGHPQQAGDRIGDKAELLLMLFKIGFVQLRQV